MSAILGDSGLLAGKGIVPTAPVPTSSADPSPNECLYIVVISQVIEALSLPIPEQHGDLDRAGADTVGLRQAQARKVLRAFVDSRLIALTDISERIGKKHSCQLFRNDSG